MLKVVFGFLFIAVVSLVVALVKKNQGKKRKRAGFFEFIDKTFLFVWLKKHGILLSSS